MRKSQKSRFFATAPILALSAVALLFGCGESPEETIRHIYRLQGDPTPENIERLRAFLDVENKDIRVTAINALVTLDVDDAAEIAVSALSDGDSFVRATAAKLVGDQEDPSLSGFLIDLLEADPSPLVRRRAAQALMRTGGADAPDAMVAALHDPDQDVRMAAIRGVRAIAPGRGVERLAEILRDDPMWEIRVQAAGALGHAGEDPVAVAALEKALEDPVEFVRTAAAKALGRPGAREPKR